MSDEYVTQGEGILEGEEVVEGNEAAAAYVGVSVNTWRPYVARRLHAPQPDDRKIKGGHAIPVWRKKTLDDYISSRPGQGARTDLTAKERREKKRENGDD